MSKLKWVVCVCLLLSVSSAYAMDYWQGPPNDMWVRGEPTSTFQEWSFENNMMPATPNDPTGNPFGPAMITVESGSFEWGIYDAPPELGGDVAGWHCNDPAGGILKITIPNDPQPRDVKYIFIQITSTKAPSDVTVAGQGPNAPYTSGSFSTGLPHIQWPGAAPFGGAWYTYNYGRTIQPNPESEDILIEVPYCTVIDQIVVDTKCAPEPGSIAMLALGTMALIRRRRA